LERKRIRSTGPRPRAFAGQKLPPAVSEIPGSLYGIGLDLLRQERVEQAYARHGARMVRKILCEPEQREFARRAARGGARPPARYLAMCFAAKEAFVKALGTGFRGVGYRDAGVVHLPSGKPTLVFSPAMQAELRRRGIGAGHVSLTDEGGLIGAFVILERMPEGS
jgi:holo-[acyl-carrier protein] synthase